MADGEARKPEWLRIRAFGGKSYEAVNQVLRRHRLNTVCRAANCPNRGECFNHGTATFLIMGPRCTRDCRFCDVQPGPPAEVDPSEPERVAAAASELKLRHVVVTSVTRDDLPDGGARYFAATVKAIRDRLPQSTVEILTPDFKGKPEAVAVIAGCGPDIFNHNLETVPRLYPAVRPSADFQVSLSLLREVQRLTGVVTKSGLMVGLGETAEELEEVFWDLAHTRVSILTIGQYLAPSSKHHPVARYLPPDEFALLGQKAKATGIREVLSGPLVRSSYHAAMFTGR
ncbi:MAG: lipoyl synthase [candidate division Zixibacteria bacterium]|nr:lipoyl synthase [candidate division Zixibacteria bacterium]